jgi:hypothetical protein
MPFGLDLKSIVLGLLIAYFVLPYVMGAISSRRTPSTNQV